MNDELWTGVARPDSRGDGRSGLVGPARRGERRPSHGRIAAITLALASIAAAPSGGDDGPGPFVIRLGESFEFSLGGGEAVRPGHGWSAAFELSPLDSAEPITLALDSFDGDVSLRILDEEGREVAADDNGGVETNARCVLRPEPGTRYTIVASLRPGEAGDLVLSAVPGAVPEPTLRARLEASVEHRRTAARRAVERGDALEAVRHRVAESTHCLRLARYAEALAAAVDARDRALAHGDPWLEFAARGLEGQIHNRRGAFAEARECFEANRAVAAATGDQRGEAVSLNQLGAVVHVLGDLAAAREFHETALAIGEALDDPDIRMNAANNLGNVLCDLELWPKAQERYQEALAACDRSTTLRVNRGDILFNIATTLAESGEPEAAREPLEACARFARESGNRNLELDALTNLVGLDRILGRAEDARERLKENLDAIRGIDAPALEAHALHMLGLVQLDSAEPAEALDSAERLLRLATSMDSSEILLQARNIAMGAHLALGHLAEAEAEALEGIQLARSLGSKLSEIESELALAAVLVQTGRAEEARTYCESALEKLGDDGSPAHRADLHLLIGSADRAAGADDSALARTQLAIEIARGADDAATEIKALGHVGLDQQRRGNSAAARDAWMRQRDLASKHGDRRGLAWALARLATVPDSDAEALAFAGEAAAVARDIGSPAGLILALETLAREAIESGDLDAAEAHTEEALALVEGPIRSGLGLAEAAAATSQYGAWPRLVQDLTALRVARAGADRELRRDAVEAGFESIGRFKSRLLLEGITEHRRGGRTAEVLALRDERRRVETERSASWSAVARAVRANAPSAEVDAFRAEAMRLDAASADLLDRLDRLSPADAALEAPHATSRAAVLAALGGERTLLVDYAAGERRLYAYALSSSGLEHLDLGERAEIERDAREFTALASDVLGSGDADEIARLGNRLHAAVLAPALRPFDTPPVKIVIVPTAALAGLPFEALVVETRATGRPPRDFGEVEFVLDRFEVSYAPSAPVLAEIAGRAPRSDRGRALVLADPVYTSEFGGSPAAARAGEASGAAVARGTFGRLRESHVEALDVARGFVAPDDRATLAALDSLRAARSGSVSGGTLELRLGRDANVGALEGDLRQYSVLHVAAHGTLDASDSRRSAIVLSAEGETREDARVSLADILDLDLDADSVVLSACDSARGEPRSGHGVESLARAFLYAGARSVVASLWPVPDFAARETMRHFYRLRAERGRSDSRALLEAKRAVRRASEGTDDSARSELLPGHPALWAPFIHVGHAGRAASAADSR